MHNIFLVSRVQPRFDTIRVAVPGTMGELVQGTLDGVPCLISCPIDLFSTVDLELSDSVAWHFPEDAAKMEVAVERTLELLCAPSYGGRIQLYSELPRGRGYASSTADMGAAMNALAEALGVPMAAEMVARVAVSVEPTDSSLLPGLALWAHRNGAFTELLGPAPEVAVVVFDPGGEIDTQRFNAQDYRHILRELAPVHREAFELARSGLQLGDLSCLGAAATLSAKVHQHILPNPLIDFFEAFAQDVDALGICRAHSGTLLGLLLDPQESDVDEVAQRADRELGHLGHLSLRRMVGGGPRSLTEPAALPTALPSMGAWRAGVRGGERCGASELV